MDEVKEGKKYDQGKLRFSLFPQGPLWKVIETLEYGARKYGEDNWQIVPGAKQRYFDAAHRHLAAWQTNELDDVESRLPHLAHAICCLIFLLWFEIVEKK